MSPTRRQILLASTGGLVAFAGCSALSDPQQSLLVAVNNFTESRQSGQVLIKNDGTELVGQYVEVPAAGPDTWGTAETRIALGKMPDGTPLDVTASFGDGLTANGQITLNCSDDYAGDAVYVQIEADLNVRLNEACYDEFPSDEAAQGGINQS
ncbi:MAG: hypothetical protein ABEJ05_09495 [Haloglomus sp.]